ncbi:MAG TPA: HAD-IIA family hydrolase [Anaerolineaceae bacterium]|nr:HAD-IIA family hydrolase [Anaerolineaceae bacterium]
MAKQKSYLVDMDGVLVKGRTVIPGANAFIKRLRECGLKFLILTNNPIYTPRDLAFRLQSLGLDVKSDNIFTSALATARFIHSQKQKHAKVYAIGEAGLTQALHDVGCVLTDLDPDYVVLGEVNHYNFEQITAAIRLIANGALFIATNPDATGPDEAGIVPATGALAALIEKATGKSPFFVGKPNPLMMRSALNYLGVHSEDTVMIGDRMDTDIIAGVMSGLETVLVLSGVMSEAEVEKYPYRPTQMVNSIADLHVECVEEDTQPPV